MLEKKTDYNIKMQRKEIINKENIVDIHEVNNVYLATVLMTSIGISIIVYFVIAIMNLLNNREILNVVKDIFNNKLFTMILSQLLIIMPTIVFLIICKKEKKNIKEILGFRKINIKTFLLIIVYTVVLIPIMSFINFISMFFVKNQISNTICDIIEKNNVIVGVVVIALLPAVIEEVLFRGVIYTAHRRINVKAAIIVNGFLFGLLHGNFNQFTYAFMIGMFFTLVVEVTKSVLSTIICHFIINANSYVISYMNMKSGQDTKVDIKNIGYSWQNILFMLLVAIIAFCISVLIIMIMAKINNSFDEIKGYMKEKIYFGKNVSIFSMSLVVSIVISFIIMVVTETSS